MNLTATDKVTAHHEKFATSDAAYIARGLAWAMKPEWWMSVNYEQIDYYPL